MKISDLIGEREKRLAIETGKRLANMMRDHANPDPQKPQPVLTFNDYITKDKLAESEFDEHKPPQRGDSKLIYLQNQFLHVNDEINIITAKIEKWIKQKELYTKRDTEKNPKIDFQRIGFFTIYGTHIIPELNPVYVFASLADTPFAKHIEKLSLQQEELIRTRTNVTRRLEDEIEKQRSQNRNRLARLHLRHK